MHKSELLSAFVPEPGWYALHYYSNGSACFRRLVAWAIISERAKLTNGPEIHGMELGLGNVCIVSVYESSVFEGYVFEPTWTKRIVEMTPKQYEKYKRKNRSKRPQPSGSTRRLGRWRPRNS